MATALSLLKRKNNDIMKMIVNKHELKSLHADEYCVRFHGPKETAYEGGIWDVRVIMPENYPFKPPCIKFVNLIYHPNIETETGSVCLDVLNEKWSPMYDLCNIFETFLPQLLTYPNPYDPVNAEAANLYLFDNTGFVKIVKMFVEKSIKDDSVRKAAGCNETPGGA